MSAQAEEVVASATSLADMARGLDEIVARFRIATDSGTRSAGSTISLMDRASAWERPAKGRARAA
jgi:hypothetical protein